MARNLSKLTIIGISVAKLDLHQIDWDNPFRSYGKVEDYCCKVCNLEIIQFSTTDPLIYYTNESKTCDEMLMKQIMK